MSGKAKSGRLIVVVGPSGAGKDTLMDYARKALEGRDGILFVQRFITRPTEAGGEAHRAVTPEEFARAKEAGAFAVDWSAHGLSYGVPASVVDEIAAGHTSIVNGSRMALPLFRNRFPEAEFVLITAAEDIRAARLASRGREGIEEIRARLSRAVSEPYEDYALIIENDGAIETAGERLVSFISPALAIHAEKQAMNSR